MHHKGDIHPLQGDNFFKYPCLISFLLFRATSRGKQKMMILNYLSLPRRLFFLRQKKKKSNQGNEKYLTESFV